MSFFARLTDGLATIAGMGSTADKRTYSRYNLNHLDAQQIEASYRSSWIMRKGVDLPPFDMTRAWRDWQAEDDQIEKIEAEEKRLGLKQKVLQALILGRLGGGALVLGLKSGGHPMLPINSGAVGLQGLSYVHVMSRHELTIGEIITDPANPLFGQPSFFTLNSSQGGQVKLHPSRVICFKGLSVPKLGMTSSDDWFWGDSVVQSVMEAVKNADIAQNAFASIIEEAKLDVYKIPGLTEMAATTEYETRLGRRMQTTQLFKSNYNAIMIDAGNADGKGGEEWETRQVTWTGIPELQNAFMGFVAGAFGIPATLMLGKSPDGMNATGKSDENAYYGMISSKQENDLRPLLERIDDVLLPSALGSVPTDIWWQFAPLRETSEKEQADIAKVKADVVKIYADSGLIPTIALEKGVQNMLVEDGTFPGLDGALAELDEEERFPSLSEPEVDPSALAIDPVTGLPKPAAPPKIAANDASPRTLYVSRKVTNVAEITAWAKGQGIADLVDDLHVTITYSRTPVDWIKMGDNWSDNGKGGITIAPGGPRVVEPLGGMAAVLMFASSSLGWRHEEMIRNGASWDWPDYQPHISLTKEPVDLSAVEPYRGKIELGPEIFEEIDPERE